MNSAGKTRKKLWSSAREQQQVLGQRNEPVEFRAGLDRVDEALELRRPALSSSARKDSSGDEARVGVGDEPVLVVQVLLQVARGASMAAAPRPGRGGGAPRRSRSWSLTRSAPDRFIGPERCANSDAPNRPGTADRGAEQQGDSILLNGQSVRMPAATATTTGWCRQAMRRRPGRGGGGADLRGGRPVAHRGWRGVGQSVALRNDDSTGRRGRRPEPRGRPGGLGWLVRGRRRRRLSWRAAGRGTRRCSPGAVYGKAARIEGDRRRASANSSESCIRNGILRPLRRQEPGGQGTRRCTGRRPVLGAADGSSWSISTVGRSCAQVEHVLVERRLEVVVVGEVEHACSRMRSG